MAKFNFSMQMQAIVVGNSSDEFVRHTTNVLKNYELEFSICPDVYQAVSRLAKTNGNVLIVGRIEQLSRENGRFFRIAGKKKAWCCCLTETNSARQYLRSLSMIGTDAFVINEPVEFEDVLTRLLHARDFGPAASSNKPQAINRDIRLTSEELSALLDNEGTQL
jgi:hypothetical protein